MSIATSLRRATGVALLATALAIATSLPGVAVAKRIILMIGDGMGFNEVQAARNYVGSSLAMESLPLHYAASTYEYGGSYNSAQAWSNFSYVAAGPTDSASAATAMSTGYKTDNGNVATNHNDASRLQTITEYVKVNGKRAGVVTTVPFSHATPAAFAAHNNFRDNYNAIAHEMITSLGNGSGARGNTPTIDVVIGGGNPNLDPNVYLSGTDYNLLKNGTTGQGWTFVERQAGVNAATSLQNAAATTDKLFGLFGNLGGTVAWRMANGSGLNPENPTLADMSIAALTVLNKDPDGFFVMLEGGAIDWGGHGNNIDQVIGEVIDLDLAVAAVKNWVDTVDPTWSETLLIITADHETGYLTKGLGIFANVPLGNPGPGILPTADVDYHWHTINHTNSLVPLFAKGAGASFITQYATKYDAGWGLNYLDNIQIYGVMRLAMIPKVTVVSITPTWGASTGAVSITDLTGTDFRAGAIVKLVKSGSADIVATGVSVVSPTKITCTFNLSGATEGQWNVVVTNDDAMTGTLTNGFGVVAPPTATSITPAWGAPAGAVSITDLAGTGFRTGATVKLVKSGSADIVATGVSVVSPTNITCAFDVSDAAVGQWDVVVTNDDGLSGTLSGGFSVAWPPTVASITPDWGGNTGSVSVADLAGTHFRSGASAKLAMSGQSDIVGTDLTVVSPSSITCAFDLSAAQLGLWDVIVTNDDGLSATLAAAFIVAAPRSIGGAKNMPAGSPVYIEDAVVTAPSLETGSVFVESSKYSGGIKLVTSQASSPGDRVRFTGKIGRVDGEYRIDNVVFRETNPGEILSPLMMHTRAVGNDLTETLTYNGTNTTGLLVKLCGRVTDVNATQKIVYVDDGGSLEDGLIPVTGLRVHVSAGVDTTWNNKVVAVLGISRVEKLDLPVGGSVNGQWYTPGTTVYVPYLDALSVDVLN